MEFLEIQGVLRHLIILVHLEDLFPLEQIIIQCLDKELVYSVGKCNHAMCYTFTKYFIAFLKIYIYNNNNKLTFYRLAPNQVKNSGTVPVHQQILALVSAPFGDSPLLKNLLPVSIKL